MEAGKNTLQFAHVVVLNRLITS